jgi:hypothetical protein
MNSVFPPEKFLQFLVQKPTYKIREAFASRTLNLNRWYRAVTQLDGLA